MVKGTVVFFCDEDDDGGGGVSDFVVFESKLLAVAVASCEGISPADCGDVATVAGTIGGEVGSVFDFSICFCDF